MALAVILLAGTVFAGASYAAEPKRALPMATPDGEKTEFFLDEPERKDPFVAGLLSWEWPGLGQFYTQNYGMGSFFLLADLVQKGVLVYMLFYYSDKYTSRGGDIVKWEDMDKKDRGIIIGYVFSFLFLRVACVLDAVYSAEKYNREIYFPYWKSRNRDKVRFSLETRPESRGINLAVTRSF